MLIKASRLSQVKLPSALLVLANINKLRLEAPEDELSGDAYQPKRRLIAGQGQTQGLSLLLLNSRCSLQGTLMGPSTERGFALLSMCCWKGIKGPVQSLQDPSLFSIEPQH